MSESLALVVMALADDELVLGHRHSEWTGYAPHLEEDVAFSSIAQDEIGHAAAYYSLVAKITGDDPDQLALGRAQNEYRNAILCEHEDRDWAYTLARHWAYDTADAIRLESLEATAHDELAALVTKIRREERYHLLHADAWMRRISHGPVEGRTKLVEAVSDVLDQAAGLFEPFETEEQALKEGWLAHPSGELLERFMNRATAELEELGLPAHRGPRADESAEFLASSSGDLIAREERSATSAARTAGLGGRQGRHSSEFASLWEDMTKTYRANPGARW